ncbi:hypothetical protein N7523_009202 [Penicillium sp. IBT 18751x]|nr:hypothetical protein N7523_009202 [Penicillium sp. IBT 18751x]
MDDHRNFGSRLRALRAAWRAISIHLGRLDRPEMVSAPRVMQGVSITTVVKRLDLLLNFVKSVDPETRAIERGIQLFLKLTAFGGSSCTVDVPG